MRGIAGSAARQSRPLSMRGLHASRAPAPWDAGHVPVSDVIEIVGPLDRRAPAAGLHGAPGRLSAGWDRWRDVEVGPVERCGGGTGGEMWRWDRWRDVEVEVGSEAGPRVGW